MSFVEKDFAWFVVLAFALWWMARGRYALQVGVLLVMSLFFYGHDHKWFIAVIVGYCTVDWATGLWIEHTPRKGFALATGVIFNLGVLCFWKYTPMFLSHDRAVDWIAPMGISFYSFAGISYMVDVYHGHIRAERNYFRYLLFTAFFPHLVAGPILRAREFLAHLGPDELPQKPLAPLEGTFLIARGFFKKMILADGIAAGIDPFFANIMQPSTAGVWSLPYVWLYALQIYFDFSGYTDIARGLGLWFGFRWPENFNWPYLATSIQDFWRRWHMTLSRFLRDYLYIPLGGNRKGELRSALNLMITMMLGGLWHGAGYSFLVWGTLHGAFLVVNRIWGATPLYHSLARLSGTSRRLWIAARIVITFQAICLAWCFFRLTRFGESVECVRKAVVFDHTKMFASSIADASLWAPLAAYLLAAIIALRLSQKSSLEEMITRLAPKPFARGIAWGATLGILAVAILLARTGEKSPFIYFQF